MSKKKFIMVLCLAAVFIVVAVLVIFTIVRLKTVERQMDVFEAMHKIPDSENAAVIYKRILADVNYAATFDDSVFAELNEAAKREKCYFSMEEETNNKKFPDRLGQVRKLALFLRSSVNNDIAEERIDEAIEKSRLILKLADHFEQQQIITYYLAGIAVEAISLQSNKYIIMEPNITEQQLQLIEKFPIKIEDDWDTVSQLLIEGEDYFARKIMENHPFTTRLVMRTMSKSITKPALEGVKKLYYRLMTDRRGNRILMGLRRFKNQNGQWPESLEQIKSFVDPNALIDPQNGSSFVYKKTEESFTLYSRGPNSVDEDGKYNTDNQGKILTDDWIIWPRR